MSKPQVVRDVTSYRRSSATATRVDRDDGTASVMFAAVMLMLSGSFNAVEGLVALLNGGWLAATTALPVRIDYTVWGWTWLIFGSIVGIAGVSVLSGRTWARLVGVVFAGLNAIVQLLFVPAYPFWALCVVAVDIIVIWALTVHGGELRE